MNSSPYFKEIVLVGGGHAHALLIRRWAMAAIPGVRLTLISPSSQTPYSGMLPGLIAGHYDFDQTHIDLSKLCHWAGVRFMQSTVTGLKPDKKTVLLNNRPELHYDLLSIDIGSVPNHSIPGAVRHSNPIKPIAKFYQQWQNIVAQLQQSQIKQKIAMVGGGAGAVETILAMAWAIKNDSAITCEVDFKLVFRGENILQNFTQKAQKAAEQACAKMQIELRNNFSVSRVDSGKLNSDQGEFETFDRLFWCTEASAPTWLKLDGIDCDEDGFILVNEYLQSVNHPDIFAAGDIAHMQAQPRPKAGVYAVRQAPYLFDNLCSRLLAKPLREFKPQDDFLRLLALGNKTAVGQRKPFVFTGDWVWRWKNRIDQKFMDQFHHLTSHNMSTENVEVDPRLIPVEEQQEKLNPLQRCGGCGAKIGIGVLSQVLKELTGAYQPEDAAVINWPQERLLQSIDQLSAPIDDPFLFGRIAVFHALSDLYAMNAQPHSLQMGVTLPFAGRDIQVRELRRLLQGVLSACHEEKVALLGGHSAEGSDLTLALSVNGSEREQSFSKQGLQSGDVLVLSKPLGSGLVLAGQMQHKTQGKDLAVTLDWMNRSNQLAAFTLRQANVHCCTDVSGFGLLGHLSEMLADTDLQVELFEQQLPILPGALALTKDGVRSSLQPQNELAVLKDKRWADLQNSEYWSVLVDPQTSGGLLAGVSPENLALVEDSFTVIGRVA